jgi:UDP-N-acetylglucosamine 2-epimerase
MASPETQEKRAKMRENLEYSRKISDSLKSSLDSAEARERMSRAAAESATPEVRARISRSVLKAFSDDSLRQKHREAVRIAQNRPEVKEKQRNRTTSPETRAKISAASTGFRHTDESKEEMRRLFQERRDKKLAESGCSTWSEYVALTIKQSKLSIKLNK